MALGKKSCSNEHRLNFLYLHKQSLFPSLSPSLLPFFLYSFHLISFLPSFPSSSLPSVSLPFWLSSKLISLSSVQFSRSVVFNPLWPHELQHTRLPCLSPTPWAYSNSCPSNRWCHSSISSSAIPFSSCLQSFPLSIRVFSSESSLCIRWPKYWSFSFSISPSNECSGLISIQNSKLGTLAVSLLAISQY